MDDGAGQTDGEAPPTPIEFVDLVTFKSQGDRGLVIYSEDTPKDKFAVMYVGGAVVHADAADLAVVDRCYMSPGHLVVSAADPGGQVGVVVAADTALDLVDDLAGGEVVAGGVSPGELRRVTALSEGDYVVALAPAGPCPWLGQVVELSLDVDVWFDDGAVCRVPSAERKLVIAGGVDVIIRTFSGFYYPGQRVRAAADAAAVFKFARWLNGTWKRRHVEGTVARVELATVIVHWLSSAPQGTSAASTPPPPPHQQNPRDLTFFCSSDGACYWAVTDRCFFRDPQRHRKTFFKRDKRARRRGRRQLELERPMSVAGTRTAVDVLWQDGMRQRGVPSASLAPFDTHVNEFVPGGRVVSLASSSLSAAGGGAVESAGAHDDAGREGSAATDTAAVADGDNAAARFGVVRSVDCKGQTARVAWLKAAPPGEEPSEVEREETVSTYDLDKDYDHDIFYGDVVVRRLPPSESGSNDGTSTPEAAGEDLSWVGHVVDLCDDAYILVKWGDGNTSKVLPHEIKVVEGLSVSVMQEAMGDWVEEDAVEEGDEDKHNEPAAAAVRIQHQRDGSADESNGEGSATAATAAGRLGAFIHALLRLPGEVLARGKMYLVGGSPTAAVTTPSSPVAAAMDTNAQEDDDGGDVDVSAAEKETGAGDDVGSGGDDSFQFQFTQFDVVEQSPPDHNFLDDTEQGTGAAKNWTKIVQKEWKILQNNLPDTIYVRAFEDRMDLLRAAMVGAAGTPYQDCLFFFDVQLPPSYPAVPPQVYYHSFGLRVNPNLDNSGTVCLSLLDTFDGDDAERWSPASSSILQVLVSIQGLVLIAQPYYSESSYERQLGRPEGARNALPYAENAYLHTLRTMLHLLRRPPAGFEALVAGHFRRRGRFVLRACEAYLRGCAVGTLDADACATAESGGERPCSAGLRLALTGVVPRLVKAFTEIGADGCEEFDDRLRLRLGNGGDEE